MTAPRICADCNRPTGRSYRARRCAPCATERRRRRKADAFQQARLRPDECDHDGCRITGRLTRGLCGTHYDRLRRTGTTAAPVFLGAEERRRRRNAARARHRRQNPDHVVAYNRAYYAGHRRQELDRNRAWRAANPERERARTAGWKRANPLRARQHWAAKNARRYAHIRATRTGPIDYAGILRRFGMRCHLCGRLIAGRRQLHFDHVIPLARGGPHTTDNIRPSHARCNQRKGARLDAAAEHADDGMASEGAAAEPGSVQKVGCMVVGRS